MFFDEWNSGWYYKEKWIWREMIVEKILRVRWIFFEIMKEMKGRIIGICFGKFFFG